MRLYAGSWYHLDAKGSGGTNDGTRDSFKPKMLEMFICRFYLRDLKHMFETDSSNRLVTWFTRPLLNASGFLEEIRSWRGFRNERECAVGLNCDERWGRNARLYMRSSGVELFAKVHGLYSTGTKSGTNWWGRSSLSGGN